MKFHLSFEGISELYELSPRERQRVWGAANRQLYRHWQMWLAMASCPLCAYIGIMLGGVVGAAIGIALGLAILSQVVARLLPLHVRTLLSERKTQSI
jgi:hypothetical protein